jgi:hypothetical protein
MIGTLLKAIIQTTWPPGERQEITAGIDAWTRWRYLRRLRRSVINDDSLLGFDEYRCIFFHVPRTGGNSISRSLFGHAVGGHHFPETYEKVFGKERFEEYFKFAFVRNPWDRVVSAFLFLKDGGMHAADREWAERHLQGMNDIPSFARGYLARPNRETGTHFVPQIEFLTDEGSEIIVDFVGRFESIEVDYRDVAGRLGIDSPLLPLNVSQPRRDYRSYFDAESLKIVESVYAADVERFGYQF